MVVILRQMHEGKPCYNTYVHGWKWYWGIGDFCMYVYTYIYIYTHIYTYIYMYACMHACMYVCMYVVTPHQNLPLALFTGIYSTKKATFLLSSMFVIYIYTDRIRYIDI